MGTEIIMANNGDNENSRLDSINDIFLRVS